MPRRRRNTESSRTGPGLITAAGSLAAVGMTVWAIGSASCREHPGGVEHGGAYLLEVAFAQ